VPFEDTDRAGESSSAVPRALGYPFSSLDG
jgi:hypothetical protein